MIVEALFTQVVSVQPLLGEGSADHVFDTARDVACYVEEVSRLIANSTSEERTAGRQSALQFSTTVVYASIDNIADFPVGSKVTLPSGKPGRVQQMNIFQGPAGLIGADHIEVHVI